MTDLIIITPGSHPGIYHALDICSHDCGGRAGHAGYVLDPKWADYLERVEKKLTEFRAAVSSDDYEEFLIGEQDESVRLCRLHSLTHCQRLLTDWFMKGAKAHD